MSVGITRHPNAVSSVKPCAVSVVVIVVRDVVDISDVRVADVHVAEITSARAIPRKEWLTPTERAPAKSATEPEANAKARAAKPGHERGRVVRPRIVRSRRPAPIAAERYPASVVEGSESPRLVFDPGPAPGADESPVTEAIRSPAHNDGARPPAGTVAGNVTPVAVFVEVFVASHFT